MPKAADLSLGARTAHAAFWTIVFSILNKCTAFLSQIGIAWFLLPEDMGLVALTLSVTGLVTNLLGANLQKILIQRREQFHAEVGQVFWLSLAMNVTAAVILSLASPLAGRILSEPRIVPLILVVCIAIPLMALPTTYAAVLCRELRLNRLAAIHFGEGILRNGGALLLAALGFKAFALVIPMVASAVYAAIAHRLAAGKITFEPPRPSKWMALVAPAGWLMLHALFVSIQNAGTSFVIGLFDNATVTGLYFWGFTLSSQAVFLLATNLQNVFFPALTQLSVEPERQFHACMKAARMLLLVAAPLCAVQITMGPSLIALLFNERWLPAAPVVQWLSVGFMFQPLTILSTSLLLARGQYATLARLAALIAALMIGATAFGAHVGAQREVAMAVGIALVISSLTLGAAAARSVQGGLRSMAAALPKPLAIAGVLLGLGFGLRALLSHQSPLSLTIVLGACSAVAYVVLLLQLAPDMVAEFRRRLPFRPRSSR